MLARSRPSTEWGAAAGDVTLDGAVVWSRTDRPARLLVEYAADASFNDARQVRGPEAEPDADFTAQVELAPLAPGRRVHYRVRFQDLADPALMSDPVVGSFAAASSDPRSDVTLAWSADTAGQGWGIDRARGGMRTYEAMRRLQPDLFVHCGDTIYADNPLRAEVALDDGTVWRNVVTPAKARVAETLDDFRGNHLYNLLDENVRRFLADVPMAALWDDHETLNNWHPGRLLADPTPYRERRVSVLAARARRAFLEYMPIRRHPGAAQRLYRRVGGGPLLEVFVLDGRSHRGDNARAHAAGAPLLGTAQLRWLERALIASRAAWKVVACSQPLGLLIPDPPGFDGVGAGSGSPQGREQELARLLRSLRAARVRNVVWITGDVHYAAAHHYHPDRARFREFSPFWEFVAGPLHAGTFTGGPLDDTFGPEVRFCAVPPDTKPNRPPSEGRQYFGALRIAEGGRGLTVRLHDREGAVLFTQELAAEG